MSFFTSTLSVERHQSSRDASGGFVPSWASTDMVSIPCSVQPYSGDLVRMLGGTAIQVDYEVYFEQVYDIRNRDRLILANGDILQVVDIRDECYQGRLFVVQASRVL